MDKKIGLILILSLIPRVIYLFFDKNIWWDAAVYLAMGEHMASLGQLGYWEAIRPLLWPFILSYSFILEINPIIWGHIFSTLFSIGCIYLTYELAKKENSSFIAARVYNENDYLVLSKWLENSTKNRIMLFHSEAYPYGYLLLRNYPDQVSFDDIMPKFD